jgi:hypothetical protein
MSEEKATLPDPFDPANLRLDQSFIESAGVRKLLTTVPIGKPNPQDFMRVHPDPAYRAPLIGLIELKEDREIYLVPPTLSHDLAGELKPYSLFTCINRQGVVRLWPVRVPEADSRVMEWHRSSAEAAQQAMTQWVRVKANMSLGAYEISVADGITTEPQWPEQTFAELLRIAFRDRLVDRLDHPVVKRLRGLS